MTDINPYESPQEPAVPTTQSSAPTVDRLVWLWAPMLSGLLLCLSLHKDHWGFGTVRGRLLFVASLLVYLGGIVRIASIFWWQIRWPQFRATLSVAAIFGFLAVLCIAIIVTFASSQEQVTSPSQSSHGHWSSIATVIIFTAFYEAVWWPTRRSLSKR